MATGLTVGAAGELLAELASKYTYIQLHDGDPGAAGTSNVADESDRMQVTWDSPSDAQMVSATDLEWTNVEANETYTFFSAWDAATSGNCGFTGTVSANAVTAGDTFKIAAGGLFVSFSVAAD